MSETHNIQIGNRVIQIEAIIRAEHFNGGDVQTLMNASSVLHVYMIDGSDFKLFDENADMLWELLKAGSLRLVANS